LTLKEEQKQKVAKENENKQTAKRTKQQAEESIRVSRQFYSLCSVVVVVVSSSSASVSSKKKRKKKEQKKKSDDD
jgi:hypothetical protein